MFELHPRLAADSVHVAMLKLCEVRLCNDANYPWLILVPQRLDIRDVHELPADLQQLLMEEICFVSAQLQLMTEAQKMNVAALGNMVPQLHVHVVARFETDPAWPGAIWGAVPGEPYAQAHLSETIAKMQQALSPAL